MGEDMIEYQRGESILRGTGQEIKGPAAVSIGEGTTFVCVPRKKSGLLDRDKVLVFHEGRFYPVSRQTTFGRGEDNDILLDDTYVSRAHGYLQPRRDGVFYLHDGRDSRGSTNGTRMLPVGEVTTTQKISRGGWSKPFALGRQPVKLYLHREPLTLQKNSDGTVTITNQEGKVHTVADAKTEFKVISLGRNDDNDVVVGDNTYVSRKHAKLYYINGVVVVEDTLSTNGTSLEPANSRQTRATEERTELKTPHPVVERVLSFAWGFSETIGGRRTMEDAHAIVENLGGETGRHFYAIYDGHSGRQTADLAAQILHNRLLRELRDGKNAQDAMYRAFIETDKEIEAKGIDDGATAIAALIDKGILFVANAGDARAVVDQDGRGVRLSHDHKADDPKEVQRITAAGGFVTPRSYRGVARVNGQLAVARALGDREFGEIVTAKPDINKMPANLVQKLILACDGVWDVISDQEAVDLVRSVKDPQKAAELLQNEAVRRGSRDNISVIVVRLQK